MTDDVTATASTGTRRPSKRYTVEEQTIACAGGRDGRACDQPAAYSRQAIYGCSPDVWYCSTHAEDWHYWAPGRTPTVQECTVCGRRWWTSNPRRRTYCTPECGRIGAQQKRRQRRAAALEQLRHWSCVHCGQLLTDAARTTRKFCSTRCRVANHRQHPRADLPEGSMDGEDR